MLSQADGSHSRLAILLDFVLRLGQYIRQCQLPAPNSCRLCEAINKPQALTLNSDMVEKVDSIWFDGQLVPWDQATVHVLTHTLHYGLAVFEGIRCYRLADGSSAVFRLREHIRRLFHSAHIAGLPLEWTEAQIHDACLEVIRANKLEACYLRPIAFIGEGAMGLGVTDNPTRFAIAAWRWGAYLGDQGLKEGIRCRISTFTRPGINALMSKAKIAGHYVNSILAKREAVAAGADEAILLDQQGYISEASGENIFVVQDRKVVTPPFGMSLLGGITRDSVLTLLGELDIEVQERLISRDELYVADEVFLCGTAAEVTPVREIDGRRVGEGRRGPVTQKVQDRFFDVVLGKSNLHPEWFSRV